MRPLRTSAPGAPAALSHGALRLSQRTTRSQDAIRAVRGTTERRGILIGVWGEGGLAPELWSGYLGNPLTGAAPPGRGPVRQVHAPWARGRRDRRGSPRA